MCVCVCVCVKKRNESPPNDANVLKSTRKTLRDVCVCACVCVCVCVCVCRESTRGEGACERVCGTGGRRFSAGETELVEWVRFYMGCATTKACAIPEDEHGPRALPAHIVAAQPSTHPPVAVSGAHCVRAGEPVPVKAGLRDGGGGAQAEGETALVVRGDTDRDLNLRVVGREHGRAGVLNQRLAYITFSRRKRQT